MDRILLVVHGEDNLSGMLEVLDGGVGWEELFPHKEDEVHEGTELDCSVLDGALVVLARSEAEVEAFGPMVFTHGNFYQHATCPSYGHCFKPECSPLWSRDR